MKIIRNIPALALVAILGLAACGSTKATTAAPTQASTGVTTAATTAASTAASTAATTLAPAPAAAAATAPAASLRTVNANTATVAEIAAVLDANGVTNSAKWAKEIGEYRPYPADDPTFASLRKNLAKYNPSTATVDGIGASLTL